MYYLNVTIHLLAAMVWIGGMLFFALVAAPVLRSVEPPALRASLFQQIGRRFSRIGKVLTIVLIVTGVLNLHFRGLLTSGVLMTGGFWSGRYGHSLAWKLAAVLLMIVFTALHDAIAERASQIEAGSPAAAHARRRSALLARLAAAAGIVAVIAAVRLARGG